MSHINDDSCGHNEEEHQAQQDIMSEELTRGYLGSLFQMMPPDLLGENLQGLLVELFVRSDSDVTFAKHIQDLVSLSADYFIGDKEPEFRAHLLAQRAKVKDMRDRAKDNPESFEADAMSELNELFEVHGTVAQDEGGDEDDLPGFYL